ncbi:MAG: cytidine deaminase [Ardenticatenaceae bacterium]|nr:cytidine deaminase [Anaerolineales bacterium]MCB8920766.1 cytidine deaminase [Ardenticatenaceae bacterium]MCB8989725.1 cytidine deaminase [Ardenticatenaceae bacterium]MCB9002816.1 cytidine deaminase [Ardenticatenaceae bacterium]
MIDDTTRDELISAACAARQFAYAPYSKYPVGAAVLGEDGRIYMGCNVENASYGLSNCAERTAVFNMVSAGVQRLLAVVVSTANAGSPCGACRQVLTEFAGDVPVWLVDGEGNGRQTTLYALLPDHFGPEHLPDSD